MESSTKSEKVIYFIFVVIIIAGIAIGIIIPVTNFNTASEKFHKLKVEYSYEYSTDISEVHLYTDGHKQKYWAEVSEKIVPITDEDEKSIIDAYIEWCK